MLAAKRLRYEIMTKWTTIDIRRNVDYGVSSEDPMSSFLRYRYKLEFEYEPEQQLSRDDYIAHVGKLLSKLWLR